MMVGAGPADPLDMPGQAPTPGAAWLSAFPRPRLAPGGFRPEHRPHRVVVLLAAVVLLSLGDLYMTLIHLLNFGMLEGNPLARAIMEHGSPAAVVIWKFVTVGFAVGVLYWARRRWAAEAGALLCCCILAWLTVQWVGYSDQISRITRELNVLAATQDDPVWVTMVPGS